MKFKKNQIVHHVLYGICAIAATKDEPHERKQPYPETVKPNPPYEYVVYPYKYLLEDNSPWFAGHNEAMENELSTLSDGDYQRFIEIQIEKKGK